MKTTHCSSIPSSNLRRTKRLLSTSVALLITSLLMLGAQAHAQENKVPDANVSEDVTSENLWMTLSLPFYNTYYYRGLNLYDDTSFQPSLSFSYLLGKYGTLGASVWAHIPVGNNQERVTSIDSEGNVFDFDAANEFVEVDPSVYYDISLDRLTFSVGHLWYTDPHRGSTSVYVNGERVETGASAPDTAEVFGSISIDTFLQPSLTVYHDYRKFDYQYYALSFSQRLDAKLLGPIVGESFNVTPYVLIGGVTNAEKVYNDSEGIAHINAGIRSTLYSGPIRITPMLQFNFGLDDSSNGIERTTDDMVIGIDIAYDLGVAL